MIEKVQVVKRVPHKCSFKFIGRSRWVRSLVFKCEHCNDVYEVEPSYLWKRGKR